MDETKHGPLALFVEAADLLSRHSDPTLTALGEVFRKLADLVILDEASDHDLGFEHESAFEHPTADAAKEPPPVVSAPAITEPPPVVA